MVNEFVTASVHNIFFPNAKCSFSPPYCHQINFSWAPMVPDVLDLKPISRWSDVSLCVWITVGGSLPVLKRIQDNSQRKHTRQREHMHWLGADSSHERLTPGAAFGTVCLIPTLLHSKRLFAFILRNLRVPCCFSPPPSLALPDDLFLLGLETCSHSLFTCVFFVLFSRTALRLTSVSTALLSRHSPVSHCCFVS